MTKTTTVEIPLTDAQRRALAEHLKERRDREILWGALVVFALLLVLGAQMRPSAPAPLIALLFVVVAAAIVTVAAIASYRKFKFDPRTAQIVKRTSGDLTIEVILNDEGPDALFIEVDGRRLTVDKSVPPVHVGTIEYTAKRGHLFAIWDRDGVLAWCAPGYEPSPADRMRITA
jgi:hypothetical protein